MNNKNTNQEVALIQSMPLFNNIDFSGLNKTIESLADSNKELSGEEKTLAVGIINEWTNEVVMKLSKRNGEMNALINFFTSTYAYYGYNDFDLDRQRELAGATGTMKLFEKYIDASETVDDIKRQIPEYPEENIDEPRSAFLLRRNEYEKEKAKIDIEVSRAERVKTLALKAWKKELNEHPDVKAMLKKAREYTRNVDKLYSECRSKGTLAKLNVTISSANTREALKELLNFSVEI